jgi:hypothetical protein
VELAVITERNADNTVRRMRSSVQPPTSAMAEQAEELDRDLRVRMESLQASLERQGLVDGASGRGSVELWYAVGKALDAIVRSHEIKGIRYRRWLWDALDNIPAGEALKRARRGRTRLHFEYCYRLAQFPENVAKKMNWSEWVYFFDSPTVRDEPRADQWLAATVEAEPQIDRQTFRRFAEALNSRIKRKDTTVLSDRELFAHYQAAWDETKQHQSLALAER